MSVLAVSSVGKGAEVIKGITLLVHKDAFPCPISTQIWIFLVNPSEEKEKIRICFWFCFCFLFFLFQKIINIKNNKICQILLIVLNIYFNDPFHMTYEILL